MSTYLQLPASVVIKLCNDKLYRIEQLRKEQWAFWIKREIDSRQWWRRWLPWLKPLTESTARQKIVTRSLDKSFCLVPDLPDNYYCVQESRVKDIRNLASRAPDGVVSLSDMDNRALQ